MSKFTRKLIFPIEPAANASGIYSAVEQLQNLNALAITAVNFCADSSGTANGLNDDTAISTAGGFVKLTGSGFTSASIVYINGISVAKYYLSNTTIVATVPAAVAGTTASLIVFNGSTVGSIWAAGISYSGFPSWTTTALSSIGLAVNAQLIAAGDAPLTYTFVSGTLPPNCTISSSGLLSGTVTGVSASAIYTFTVAVTDAQNQNVSQSIVYTLVVSDFYYRYNSLHISGDSNPTWITDASTNALAVTPTGSPQATTFSPLEAGYYGNSFNGSSDYLTLPSTAGLAMGTGDFTIEFWYYPLQADKGIFQLSTTSGGFLAGNTNTIALFIGSINNVGVYANGTTTYGGNNKLLYNVWTHIALVRISSVTKLYINGVLDTSFASGGLADTTNYTGTYGVIGGYYSTSYLSNAYISNFRIVKGTAIYTANFTPSATPLTAITNTSLLTCQSNRFIDNSAAPATITVAGAPKVVSSNPFNLPAGLAAHGAGYFDGSSYVKAADSTAFDLSSGDWTIEAWYYLTATPGANGFTIVSNCNSNTGAGGWGLMVASLSQIYLQGNNNSQGYISFTSVLNTWNHVAVIRSGTGAGSSSIYVNGVKYTPAGNGAGNPTFASTNVGPYMGYGQIAGSYATGYISNVHVVKGTSIYGANPASITVPTAPLTAITNTSLLTLQTNVPHNNSQFRDTSTNNALITRYGNTTQGSFSPFTKQYPYSTATVGGSAYFDGTGDYLTLPANSATSFGTKDFTVEFWMNTTGPNSQMLSLVGGTAAGNWQCTLYNGNFYWQSARNTTDALYVASAGITDSAWHHIAITRASNTLRIFFDGVQKGTVSDATNYNVSSVLNIGYSSSYFGGYLSNIRLIAGIAAYTNNFTPSTAPLAITSNTTLLLPFTNAAVYDNTMLNNFETVGNAGVSTAVTKYGSGAMYFNGTTDYLTTSPTNQSGFAFGSGDFTIEMWVNPTVLGAANKFLYDGRLSVDGAFPSIYVNASSLVLYLANGATQITGGAISTATWTHIAICRSGTSTKLFINGTQSGSTYTDSTVYLNNPLRPVIGSYGPIGGYWNGYIDDLRITKGYARYTTAFTPSTSSYSVSAPFGTSILPSKSLRFRSSASAYLNRTPATTTNQKTFTWSAWVKLGNVGTGTRAFFNANPNSSTDGFNIYIGLNSDNDIGVSQLVSASNVIRCATNAVYRDPAAWYHVVVVVDTTQATNSNGVVIYVNGAIQTLTFNAYTQNANTYVNSAISHQLGRSTSASGGSGAYYDGEMAEINFVDGLALDRTMFGAYSTYGQWLPISYAGYQGANGFYLPFTNTTGSSFSSYAGTFDGSTQSITAPSNAAFQFTGDFTIECWLYQTASNVGKTFYACGSSGTTDIQCNIATSSVLSFYSPGGGGSAFGITGTTSLAQNTWYHVAITRSGSTVRLFVNGILDATGTSSATMPSVLSAAYVGSYTNYYGNQYWFAGRISNFRVVKGTAVYTSNFIVPTTALTAISGTSLLTLQNATIIDNSTNAFTITNNGTVVTSTQTVTTAATQANLTADSSGNGNNWTPNNISLTAGSTYDSLTDVPTLTSATVANYAVLNPLQKGGSINPSSGNLQYLNTASAYFKVFSTIGITSGKWYVEYVIVASSAITNGRTAAGLARYDVSTSNYFGFDTYSWGSINTPGNNVYNSNTGKVLTTGAFVAGDVLMLAYDADAGKLWFGVKGAWDNGNDPSTGSTPSYSTNLLGSTGPFFFGVHGYTSPDNTAINFGQQPFTYTPPSGFLPLNTFNI